MNILFVIIALPFVLFAGYAPFVFMQRNFERNRPLLAWASIVIPYSLMFWAALHFGL